MKTMKIFNRVYLLYLLSYLLNSFIYIFSYKTMKTMKIFYRIYLLYLLVSYYLFFSYIIFYLKLWKLWDFNIQFSYYISYYDIKITYFNFKFWWRLHIKSKWYSAKSSSINFHNIVYKLLFYFSNFLFFHYHIYIKFSNFLIS